MKSYLDCIPCFFRQALFAARLTDADEATQLKILKEPGTKLDQIDLSQSPPQIAMTVYSIVDELTGDSNPFGSLKKKYIERVLDLHPTMTDIVRSSPDPLRTAVRLAIAGNVIDFGVNESFDLAAEVESAMETPFSIDDMPQFRADLEKAQTILYLGDNAGETVFDTILLSQLPGKKYYAVRGGPIINDATFEDAEASGIGNHATIISTGLRAPGTILSKTSPEFREIWNHADIIISKGQGNYESLSDETAPIYFLFKIKCPITARHIGSPVGNFVLAHSKNRSIK